MSSSFKNLLVLCSIHNLVWTCEGEFFLLEYIFAILNNSWGLQN